MRRPTPVAVGSRADRLLLLVVPRVAGRGGVRRWRRAAALPGAAVESPVPEPEDDLDDDDDRSADHRPGPVGHPRRRRHARLRRGASDDHHGRRARRAPRGLRVRRAQLHRPARPRTSTSAAARRPPCSDSSRAPLPSPVRRCCEELARSPPRSPQWQLRVPRSDATSALAEVGSAEVANLHGDPAGGQAGHRRSHCPEDRRRRTRPSRSR